MKLLYFATSTYGGLADYAREQAAALVRRGVDVDVLCAPGFAPAAAAGWKRHALLDDTPERDAKRGRLARATTFLSLMIGHHRQLARTIRAGGHRHVLLASYAEYFAPLWSAALRRLAHGGVTFGAVIHDPVRDAAHGPSWWHRRAIADAYSFLTHAFVHEKIALDTIRPMPRLRTTVIPHGPYRFQTDVPDRDAARAQLGLPHDKPVLLAFGHIRDNKNLHLVIESLTSSPDLQLVVAGSELSSGQRTAAEYQALARAAGVDGRCHWHVRFIREAEAGVFFAAADFVSLTYSRTFRSASGVLSAATQFRKPCLASSGPSALRVAVEKYQLGVWVEPDDAAAISRGLRSLLAGGTQPRWDDYARENSWERNADIVASTFFPHTA